MSFSKKVKKELCEVRESSRFHRKLLLYGIIYGLREVDGCYHVCADNEAVVALLKKLLPENSYTLNDKLLVINNTKTTADYLSLIDDDKTNGLFLRGVFISAGTISDPNVEYHLELSPPEENKNVVLEKIIREHGISIKKSERKNAGTFLYIKESDSIADFLTFIGAVHCAMEIMNIKIYKEVRNNVNRTVNCETANMSKTVNAAVNQIEDIELIYKLKGEGFLSDDLAMTARLRLENPVLSLFDIAQKCEPRLSRSGVNHRLNRIKKIAEELRKNG
ncbi:MAG: DNA-binding protein WhiA [Oscillospiraceae bacterium]|nr:DNA-binding protein WhiA [Oscillospiraceae bacterium]